MAKARSKMMQVDPAEHGKFRIALYERVSTDAQAEEGYSIDIQKERLEAYVKSITAEPESIRHYTDDGFSGGNIHRPGLEKLILDIQAGEITHVIVYKLDRLSRSQKDTLYLIEDIFIPNQVSFISVQESFNTATAFGRAVIGILSVFAQLERENIYERTRSGMQKRIENGYWLGGHTIPFGYNYDAGKGTIVPNADAEIVKKIFTLYINGESEASLAKKFNLCHDRHVHAILNRRAYTGVIRYKGEWYPGLHEPLISEETYRTAQNCMKERSAKKLVTKTDHLFTGLLECGICGAKMRYQKWGNSGYRIYCYSQQKSKPYLVKDPDCDNTKIDADELERIVLDDIFHMAVACGEGGSGAENTIPDKPVAEVLQERLKIAENKIRRLYSLFAESGNEYLLETIEKYKNEIEELKKQIREEEFREETRAEAEDIRQKIRTMEGMWQYLTQKERIAAVRSIVDKIIITHNTVKINYKI